MPTRARKLRRQAERHSTGRTIFLPVNAKQAGILRQGDEEIRAAMAALDTVKQKFAAVCGMVLAANKIETAAIIGLTNEKPPRLEIVVVRRP